MRDDLGTRSTMSSNTGPSRDPAVGISLRDVSLRFGGPTSGLVAVDGLSLEVGMAWGEIRS